MLFTLHCAYLDIIQPSGVIFFSKVFYNEMQAARKKEVCLIKKKTVNFVYYFLSLNL